MKAIPAVLLALLLAACAATESRHAATGDDGRFEGPRRFRLTPLTEMTPEQRAIADAIGYYVLVAMTVNVDRTPIPNNGAPPLPKLK